MSPHLFLLCMEYLSCLLLIRTKDPDFAFHTKCALDSITHLAFVDDLLLFTRGDPYSTSILADTLEEFANTSGLKINRAKSQIFLSGVRPYEQQQIMEYFEFPLGVLPVKHLGLPLSGHKLNIRHCSPLVDQIVSAINHWSNNFLSLAGRIELIQSILQEIECY